MASWYRLFLGNAADAFACRLDVQEGFVHAYMAAGQPHDMAMFSTLFTDEELTLYFSPPAEAFARTVPEAVPCARPSREHLALEVGHPHCWHLLFQ